MAKVIMIQGTSSGVGKTVLSAALCRIFTQDGLKTAPFKAQNMSGNFHVLENGDRMARSQAIAAYACRLEPCADMNPILLIPSGKGGAQVVAAGKPVGMMDSRAYGEYRPRALEQALESYHRLAARCDVIVAEGAGSPVEMNLLENDVANMGFAQRAKAPVILVADIIRGGVFASLYGTLAMLAPEQRELVKGLVINKFVGDRERFAEGRELLARLCERPVVGVVPQTEINLEDEDNLTDQNGVPKTRQWLAEKSGGMNQREYIDAELDRLAEHFRKHLDMDAIRGILMGDKRR